MIFFSDLLGNITPVQENVNQNSNDANKIYFVSGIDGLAEVWISFILPNGYIVPVDDDGNPSRLRMTFDKSVPFRIGDETQYLSVFKTSVLSAITQLAGNVTAQIYITNGNQTLATQSVSFRVAKGVPSNPQDPSEDVYEQILAALNEARTIALKKVDFPGEEIKLINSVLAGYANAGAYFVEMLTYGQSQRYYFENNIDTSETGYNAISAWFTNLVNGMTFNTKNAVYMTNYGVSKETAGNAVEEQYRFLVTIESKETSLGRLQTFIINISKQYVVGSESNATYFATSSGIIKTIYALSGSGTSTIDTMTQKAIGEAIQQGLATRLPLMTGVTAYDQVYAKKADGTNEMRNATSSLINNAIVARSAEGRAQVNDPVNAFDIANKEYTDNQDSKRIAVTEKGVANGVATIGSDGKIPISQLPDHILGGMVYGGTFSYVNEVHTLTLSEEAIIRTGKSATCQAVNVPYGNESDKIGYRDAGSLYFKVTGDAEFSFAGYDFNPSDQLIASAEGWDKIDNTDKVNSVNGMEGDVVIPAVQYNVQELTDEQKEQARDNINVYSKSEVYAKSEVDEYRLNGEPVLKRNLTASDLIPITNTYYKHTGTTTENFTEGVIYLYTGSKYKAINGEGGIGFDSLISVDLTYGESSVMYDTTDGITLSSTARFVTEKRDTDVPVDIEIPIIAGDNISIDKASDSEKIVIKAEGLVKKTNSSYQVYLTDSSGNQSTRYYSYNSTPAAYSFPIFSGFGTLETNNPSNALDCVNKQYLESNAVLKNNIANGSVFYKYVDGSIIGLKVSYTPLADAISLYNDGGILKTATPINPTDAANKKYVDDKFTFKTLFGNQSITGLGNIDLYRHNISFQDKVFFTPISSKSLEINSLTDLQTAFPDDVWMLATGLSADDTKQVIAINCSQMKVRYADNSESSLAEYESPVDIVTTI